MERVTERALAAQKQRCIAEILEANDKAQISDADRAMIRKATLDAVNDLYRNALQIFVAAEEGLSVNELLIDRLTTTNGH